MAGGAGDSGAVGASRARPFAGTGEGGMPHRNARAPAIAGVTPATGPTPPTTSGARAPATTGTPLVPPAAREGVLRGFGVGRGPPVDTRSDGPVKVTSTAPSVSVRYVRSATVASRSSVAGAGWPYEFPAPAETTATLGRTASRNAWVLADFEPWWATFSRSTGGSPRASSSGSTPSSTSPMSRNRCGPTSPSSTIETLLIDAPPSGGRSGTRLKSGQSTRRRIESTVNRSPVDNRPCGVPPAASVSLQASYPAPGPRIPGS
jgi:hypothetical protein